MYNTRQVVVTASSKCLSVQTSGKGEDMTRKRDTDTRQETINRKEEGSTVLPSEAKRLKVDAQPAATAQNNNTLSPNPVKVEAQTHELLHATMVIQLSLVIV